jgi:DNA-binding transcriptional LysR family regulator
MRIEVRHLRTLDAISQAGSLTRAAALLGVSQPAVTMQLARIERLLGAKVFTRSRRGITPTPFGEFVLARTRAVLSDVDDILAARPGAAVSTVRVGGFGGPVLTALTARLHEPLPGVRAVVHTEYFTRLLFDMVAHHRLDLALVTDYPGHELRPVPGVEQREVAVEPVFVALSAGHPLARRTEIGLLELARESWVLPPSDGTGWPEHFLEVCADRGLSPQVRYRMVDAVMRRELIAAGRAVAPCQWTFEGGDGVVVRPLAGDPLRMRYLLIWNSDGPLAGHADDLLALARDVYAAAAHDALTGLGRRPRAR